MPTFDGDNLIVTLDAPTVGALTLDVTELYKQWKQWILGSYGRLGYPPLFFDSFGGNDLTTGIKAGAYFVLQNNNGWRIRSTEEDQTVYVVGNLTPADSTLPIVIPTIGAYTVMFDGLQPVTQNVDTIINEQEDHILSLQYLIESQRPHHTGTGDIWYWNPYAGDDANDGKKPTTATKTFAKAHSLASDHNHDIIICIPGNPSGKTITTENIVISKNYLFVRGSGRGFEIKSINDALDAISIIGDGVELSGLQATTSATNTKWAIHTTGNFTMIKDVWVYGAVNGVHFENGEYGIADNVKMHHNLGVGLKFSGTCDHVDIIDCHIGSNYLDNIVIDLDASTHEVNFLGYTSIHGSVTGYGINISSTTNGVIIGPDVTSFNNSSGNVNDLGSNTYNSNEKLIIMEQIMRNESYTDPVSGDLVILNDAGDGELYRIPIWENVAKTTPYAGSAINRRMRIE